MSSAPPVVAHVVVVAFHAQLGNRIEFAYPRLSGNPVLRRTDVTDTADISSDCSTPTLSNHRPVSTTTVNADGTINTTTNNTSTTYPLPPPSSSSSSSTTANTTCSVTSSIKSSSNPQKQTQSPPQQPQPQQPASHSWGVLPPQWAFLPFMALPDGVHARSDDLVFFTLPVSVHCVSCFRQVPTSSTSATLSASASTSRSSYERDVAARGSVQKSVVLLCHRPLFGALADRLVPAVRAYFDQADFANTSVLSSLFHSLNNSLARPSLASSPDTLFHGLDLQTLVRKLGPQLIAVLKLILLEKRIVIYSQPVRHSSNAVVALASIFHGALDTITSRAMPTLDTSPADSATGFPLSLFGPDDRVILQPYAPLPLLSQLLPPDSRKGCLIGTSHNVGLLLSTTAAAHARKMAAAAATAADEAYGDLSPSNYNNSLPIQHTPQSHANGQPRTTTNNVPTQANTNSNNSNSNKPPTTSAQPKAAGVPVVDALVNLSTGRVSVSAALEPFCRVTHAERNLMRDLVVAASRVASPDGGMNGNSSSSLSSSQPSSLPSSTSSVSGGTAGGVTSAFVGSDDYIRARLRQYLQRLMQSVSSVDGVLGGPVGGEAWSDEMASHLDFAPLHPYNEAFVQKWATTRNLATWARTCSRPPSNSVVPPPKPEVDPVPHLADNVAAGLSGLRQNVADFGRFSSLVSAKAAEGLASLFRRIEQEVAKMDTAVGRASPRAPGNRNVQQQPQQQQQQRVQQVENQTHRGISKQQERNRKQQKDDGDIGKPSVSPLTADIAGKQEHASR